MSPMSVPHARQRRLTGLAAAALLIAVTPAAAQPASAPQPAKDAPRISQEVFVTATVTPIPTTALSRSVASITRSDVEQLGLRSIIEAMRLIPGVDPRARGPRDVQTDFSIRGATFGQHLVLADGMRLNDSQSGHHNGEIPLPSVAIDRVEIVSGAGSSVHGADALGGTINVITRRDAHAIATFAAGQYGLYDTQASAAGGLLPDNWTAAGWASHSDGFMDDRDFTLGGVAVRGTMARSLTLDVRHQRRAFGANGFYGPSPSKEWTDQTLAAARWQHTGTTWTTTTGVVFKNHGDHFLWDINRPGFAENRHRTNSVDANVEFRRPVRGAALAVGGSAGGDGVQSSNLGDHEYTRISGFAELQVPIHTRTSLQAGLRIDEYSSFGSSVSPTASFATSVTSDLRVRASAGHAFRIPTFTELYYSDPNSVGSANLRPERGWTLDGGLDWTHGDWMASASVFRRWDEDVIDFVRPAPGQRFQATNVRDVTATGFETSLTHRWASALVRLSYAGLDVDAPDLTLESRYVLEYAPHQTGVSVAVPIVLGARLAVNLDHRIRRDGQNYALVGTRVSRPFRRVDLFLDASNLFDETYTEIKGVAMPGRWVSGGVTVR
jgi:outer membrane cobalamin receptor